MAADDRRFAPTALFADDHKVPLPRAADDRRYMAFRKLPFGEGKKLMAYRGSQTMVKTASSALARRGCQTVVKHRVLGTGYRVQGAGYRVRESEGVIEN